MTIDILSSKQTIKLLSKGDGCKIQTGNPVRAGDFYKREKFVKSGFKKWRTVWRDEAIKRYNKINKSKHKKYR